MNKTKDENELRRLAGNAIRSLYQIILFVQGDTMEYRILDQNKELRSISDEAGDFFEFRENMIDNVHPQERELFAESTEPSALLDILSGEVYFSFDCRLRHTDRKYYWSRVTLCNADKEDSSEGNDFLLLLQDIHAVKTAALFEEREQREIFLQLQKNYDRLYEENMTDAQTGCYNRKGLQYHTEKTLQEIERTGKHLFVCVADLNGLKYLNDTYGHTAGDEAIAAVSGELRKASPEGACIVRTGGDEFLIMAALDKDSNEPQSIEGKVDEGLRLYNEKNARPFTIGASLGWVFAPLTDGSKELDQLIEEADARMYEQRKKRDLHRRG